MPVILNLKEELKKEQFKELEFEVKTRELDLPESYIVSQNDKFNAHLHLLKDEGNYVITLSVDTQINMQCDRCLAIYPQKIVFSESVIFSKKPPTNFELSEEELYTEFLEDEENFNLYEFIRTEIIVNTPMKLLCKEDCKGLCPFCGIDKNKESCDCERRIWRENSPFSKLQKLIK